MDVKPQIICINGEVLSNKLTGVERYVYEILLEIDRLIDKSNFLIYLLLPKGCKIYEFSNIKMCYLRTRKGNTNKLSKGAIAKFIKDKKRLYVNMAGGMILKPNSIVCFHDMRMILYRKYDPYKIRLKATIVFWVDKFLKAQFVTVSHFSQYEICRLLHIDANKISVIGNGWEHINRIDEDLSFWERHPQIEKNKYFYSLSSRLPHKNFVWVEEVAKRNRDKLFIIGGEKIRKIKEQDAPDNVIYLGYISDQENKTLMRNCIAFIHPAKYEGFGITPLEAMACGAQVFCSRIPVAVEIFENSVHYFNPDNYEIDLDAELQKEVGERQRILNKYSWRLSAIQWLALFNKLTSDRKLE